MPAAEPFASNAEYLDSIWAMLATRSRRLALVREQRRAEDDTVEWPRRRGRPHVNGGDDVAERLAALAAREERQVDEIEARLRATRSSAQVRPLGLDRLALAHGLGDQERIVLALAACFALSEDLAEHVCADLGTGFAGNGSVEFHLRFLECDSTADRVRARRIFAPNAPLLRAGLIMLDRMRNESSEPEDLLWCRPRITQAAFDVIIGSAPELALVEADG